MKLIYCLLLLLPMCVTAQKPETKENSQLSGQSTVKTAPIAVVQSQKAKLSFSFSADASQLYLEMSSSDWGVATINIDDLVILKLDNAAEVKVKSTEMQTFHTSLQENNYTHRYLLAPADLSLLSRHNVVAVRKFMFSDFVDLRLPANGAAKFRSLSNVFLDELNKQYNPPTLTNIQATQMEQHIGRNVTMCGTVYITRFFESFQNKATILDFQSTLSGPKGRAIIWKDDLRKLGNLPKAFYTNKQVCISGLVYLYDQTPYIQISDKKQIRILSSLTTDEARFFINDTVTISGVIENISFNPQNKEQVVVQLKSSASSGKIDLVINDATTFSNGEVSQKLYLNKTIEVTGKLTLREKQLQMILQDKDAMHVKDSSLANENKQKTKQGL